MKICILVATLLSLGASALPEAEESINVGGHTYKGGDLPKGELKRSDATASRGLAEGLGSPATLVDANVQEATIVIHAMAGTISASRDLVMAYASGERDMYGSIENFHGSGHILAAITRLESSEC
ncbi:hypothetical protein E4U57_006361 [Claviceps arundinis]|uniref:Uncharacterized protein n=1 Tax=Claviceps arundinis TaxID=1623583 RepID=A0ABQ7P204_9HYPO|nr:hypothetical protein E4U57_006361 [Claviceps arundinis]